jgi:hypothetical protein
VEPQVEEERGCGLEVVDDDTHMIETPHAHHFELEASDH